MKKMINLFLFIIITSSLYSQNKICHTNIDIGIGFFSVLYKPNEPNKDDIEDGGLALNINTNFKINKNIIALNILYGRFDDYLSGSFKLFKIGALYGTQLKVLFKKIIIEPSVGIGLYNQTPGAFTNSNSDSAINFPLRMSLIFFPGGKRDIGLNANYDINKLNRTFSANVFLRVNFNK